MNHPYTKRIEASISTPKFKESLEAKDLFLNQERTNIFESKIDYNDKTLFLFGILNKNSVPIQIQAIKYSTNLKSFELALIETICKFCQEKDIREIEALSLREIDNFLRDNNASPAFPGDGTPLYPLFEKIKQELKKLLNPDEDKVRDSKSSPNIADDYKGTSSLFPFKEKKSFLELNQNERILFIQNVIDLYISPLLKRDGGGIYPVFIDDSLAVVQYTGACTSCNLSLTSTMDYIQRVIQLETKVDNLMVMTDS